MSVESGSFVNVDDILNEESSEEDEKDKQKYSSYKSKFI
jgi:hypothetical protein